MIVLLLNCGISWSNDNDTFLYGGASDSVLVAYEDLRTANAKMVELEYEKQINEQLGNVIRNDSLIISGLDANLKNVIEVHKLQTKKIKRQRNILAGSTVTAVFCLILSLVK